MIAQRMSARVMPTLLGVWGIGASLFKAFGLAMVKFLTAIVWDVPILAGGAAIVWGIHFIGTGAPIGTIAAWIVGGVLTILFVWLSVKPLR